MKGRVIGLICIVICVAILFCACSRQASEAESITNSYPELSEESACCFASQECILDMLNHGTGIIFFTWEDCPWCHKYITYLNEAAENQGASVLCYDLYNDREEGSEFYKKVVTLLEDELAKEGAYDAAGRPKIYVPMAVFMVNGEVVGYDMESSMISGKWDDIDSEIAAYWSALSDNGQTREYNLKKKLNQLCYEVAIKVDEIESRGCGRCDVSK